jgi:hypothetical protein
MHGGEISTTALDRLGAATPKWARWVRTGTHSAIVTASAPRAGGTSTRTYQLRVMLRESSIVVIEQGASLLPSFCPERHINGDRSFCLGLRAGQITYASDATSRWWNKLAVFLSCQDSAHESRMWPEQAQLTHGEEGAELEIEAEVLAADLGMTREYMVALREKQGSLYAVARRADLSANRVRNGRAQCICRRKDKGGCPLLRRQCWKAEHPCLAVIEGRRQSAEAAYWATVRKRRCCGTLDECPLRKHR